MTVQKWNFKKHEYSDYEVNPDFNSPLLSEPDEIVNCINCGKKVTFRTCYTSKQYHNKHGIGFPVCEHCYEVEKLSEKSIL